MMDMNERTIGLLGEEKFKKLHDSNVCVIGLGGVGGTALEALVRSGVNNLVIIDYDEVNSSNLNRQILYSTKDVGIKKIEAAESKIRSISESLNVKSFDIKINKQNIQILNDIKIDFVIDAIDDIDGKIAIAEFCKSRNIPFVVSLGMANKIDPEMIEVASLNKSCVDPLGKKYRYELKNNNIDINNIVCVFSKESPKKDGKKLNSIITTTSVAGLYLADYVIKQLIGD